MFTPSARDIRCVSVELKTNASELSSVSLYRFDVPDGGDG
jgi:hypothetical protein